MQKTVARDFFASLRYIDSDDIRQHGWRRTRITDGYPIFTPEELSHEPLKWLKYVLLGRLGLRPLHELGKEIKRFPVLNWAEAQEQCIELLINAKQQQQQILVVIKLVPMDSAGQLPNFRITGMEAVASAFRNARAACRPIFKEMWLCGSAIDVGGLNLAGRITLPGFNSTASSIIEVVWYTSPRLIENLDVSTFPYPYLRAQRLFGRSNYQVEQLHIPTSSAVNGIVSQKELLDEFAWIMKQIFFHREKIADLEAIVANAGANELSLEFKSDNGNFRFIDWDTEVETSGWINRQ